MPRPGQAAQKQYAWELASHGVCCNYVIRRPPIFEANPGRQSLQTKTEVLLLGAEEGARLVITEALGKNERSGP